MNKYLVVVDYQSDFVEGSLGFPGAETLDPLIEQRIKEYGPGHVGATKDTHGQDYLSTREGKELPIVHCIKGTKGWEFYGKTAEALKTVNASVVEKPTFGLTTQQVEALNIPDDVRQIEVCGLVSYICVINVICALRARYPEVNIVVDHELVGGPDPATNEAVLTVLRSFQVKVI